MGFVFSAAFCSWYLLRALVPQLRCFLIDQPNDRSSHSRPTPRGGGVVFVLLSAASSTIVLNSTHEINAASLPLLAAPLAFVGLVDDRHHLPALGRFAAQLLTSVLILCCTPFAQRFGLFHAPASLLLLPFLALLLISVTAVINFTNFMDGLDGLVAGCMAVTIYALAIALNAPFPILVLVGSLLGFLLWNWSPAKIFMGDVGSTFLGAVFSGLVLQASSPLEALGYLLVATPLLGDAFSCVSRRLLAGQRVFQAHRLHLFQRLNQAGWPHARVSLTYIAATAVLGVAMLTGGWVWVIGLSVVEIFVGIWLDQHVAVPFDVASQT